MLELCINSKQSLKTEHFCSCIYIYMWACDQYYIDIYKIMIEIQKHNNKVFVVQYDLPINNRSISPLIKT